MTRDITQEQVELLEQHHGKGMVVVLSVGDTDFAFRRLSALDADLLMDALSRNQFSAHEEAAVRCVLSADAPEAGKGPDEDKKLPEAKRKALIGERDQLTSLFSEAQLLRDWIGMALSQHCGFGARVSVEALGSGRYRLRVGAPEVDNLAGAEFSIELEARAMDGREYGTYREREMLGAEGAAERYAFDKLVQSANKADFERLYPLGVIGVGRILKTLGTQGKAVRVKKFGAGSPKEPGSSGERSAKAGTSE